MTFMTTKPESMNKGSMVVYFLSIWICFDSSLIISHVQEQCLVSIRDQQGTLRQKTQNKNIAVFRLVRILLFNTSIYSLYQCVPVALLVVFLHVFGNRH